MYSSSRAGNREGRPAGGLRGGPSLLQLPPRLLPALQGCQPSVARRLGPGCLSQDLPLHHCPPASPRILWALRPRVSVSSSVCGLPSVSPLPLSVSLCLSHSPPPGRKGWLRPRRAFRQRQASEPCLPSWCLGSGLSSRLMRLIVRINFTGPQCVHSGGQAEPGGDWWDNHRGCQQPAWLAPGCLGAGMQRGAACAGHPLEPAHRARGAREPSPSTCRSGALPTACSPTQRWGRTSRSQPISWMGRLRPHSSVKAPAARTSLPVGCLGGGGPYRPVK